MKNNNAFYLIVFANALYNFIQGITAIAIPWYFINEFGLPTLWGVVYFIVTILTLFWGVYSGTMIDKYDRKKIFILNPLVAGVLTLLLALYGTFNEGLHPYLVGLAFSFIFLGYTIHFPNLYALCQEITESRFYGRITSIIEIQGQISLVLSGTVAAVLMKGTMDGNINVFGMIFHSPFLIEKFTIVEILWTNAIGMFLVMLIACFFKFEIIRRRNIDKGSISKRILYGFSFLKKHPYLFLFGILSFMTFFSILIVNFMLSPMYVSNQLNAAGDVYGISEIYFGLGSSLAGAVVYWIFKRWNEVIGIMVLMFLAGFILIFASFNASVWIYYLIFFIIGFSNAGIRVLRVTYLLNIIPTEIIGRANSVFNVINNLFRICFIGLFTFPFFSDSNHVIYAFFILGIVLMISLIITGIFYKKIMKINVSESWSYGSVLK